MKISLTRSGGFGGITLPPKVLSTEDATVKILVERALASAPSGTGTNTPDGFQYTLTIDDNGQEKIMRADDGTMSNELQELIDHILA